jgi:hypothetical protein
VHILMQIYSHSQDACNQLGIGSKRGKKCRGIHKIGCEEPSFVAVTLWKDGKVQEQCCVIPTSWIESTTPSVGF